MVKKTALVTGSRRGIGLGIARKLGQDGYQIIVSATKEQDDAVIAALRGEGIDCKYIPCNIADAQDRARIFEDIRTRYGRLDVLVNNAGVAPDVRLDLLETTEESFDRLMNINLKGTFFMCQTAANAMIAMQNAGLTDYSPRIINISSMSAYTSSTNRGEYCVSKAGIAMTTQLFADRLAEYGISIATSVRKVSGKMYVSSNR